MLYKVTKTIEAYVQADSQREALGIDLGEDGCDVFVTVIPVTGDSRVSEEWLSSFPFRDPLNCELDLTVEQLMELMRKESA